MTKRLNPYQRLFETMATYCRKVEFRHHVLMLHYPRDEINKGSAWKLRGLYERTLAADQLGYDVVLRAQEDRLQVLYVKKLPEIPMEMLK